MIRMCAIVAVLLALGGPGVAQEVLQPLAGDLEVIDARLAGELGLFPEVVGFREARLFQDASGAYVLEVWQRLEGRTVKQRRPMTSAQVEALRQRLAGAMAVARPAARLDDRGRTGFLVWTFALSYGFYSWAVPVSLDLDGRAAQATALTIGSAGFAAPFRLTRRVSVSRTHEVLSTHGGRMGALYGLALSQVVRGGANGPRVALGTALAGSVGGLAGGFRLAGRSGWSAGTAQVLSHGGVFGFAFGGGTAHLLGLLEDEQHTGPALMLLGAGGGYWAARHLAAAQPYTRGDADVVGLTALLGAYVPVSLCVLADVDVDRVYTAAAMGGAVAGVAAGDRWVRGRDFAKGPTRLLTLGTVAGGLLGAAVAIVVDPHNDGLTATLSAAGAGLGYAVTFGVLAPEAHDDSDDRDDADDWQMGFDPLRRRVLMWRRLG